MMVVVVRLMVVCVVDVHFGFNYENSKQPNSIDSQEVKDALAM